MENTEIKIVPITTLKINDENPRTIRSEKFQKLVQSIKEFPEMLKLRPVIINNENVVLGGNMRLRACLEAGLTEVPTINVGGLSEEKQQEFIIKDNVSFGEWDWNILANNWDVIKLNDWSVAIPGFTEIPVTPSINGDTTEKSTEGKYTRKVEAPTYEPSENMPSISELCDSTKYNEMVKQINSAKVSDEIKMFLIRAAGRHIVFDYSKIADFYSISDKAVQDLMEKSALVIIDFDKAIENGFVQLSQAVADQFSEEKNYEQIEE